MRRVTDWEYLRLSTEIGSGDADGEDDWMSRLTSHGHQGWEVVGPVVLHDRGGDVRFLLMKRAVRD